MKGRFGKGCIPSPLHKVGLGHPYHLLEAQSLAPSASVALPPPVDQGQTSSCTGNSSAVAICAAMTKTKGLPLGQWEPLPSRLWLYFQARAVEGSVGGDDGAMISDIFDGAAVLGVPPESIWTFSEDLSKITANPDFAVYRAAADQKLIKGAWRIISTGQQRVRDVQAALANGNAVVLGTALDNAFEDLTSHSVWAGVTGEIIGGHAIVCCAYRTNSFGQIEFQLQNSWGGSWCDNGRCWIAANAIASPNCSDLWIVESAPAYSEAA